MRSDSRDGGADANESARTDTMERPPVQGSMGPPGEKPLSLALSRWRGDGPASGTTCGAGGR